MSHRWTGLVALGVLTLLSGAGRCGTPETAPDGLLGAEALAGRIDYRVAHRLSARGARAAPPADDAEFIRRVCLDLAGCVPSVMDARDFLDDDRPDKRRLWVEMLLDGRKPDAYALHFANVWWSAPPSPTSPAPASTGCGPTSSASA